MTDQNESYAYFTITGDFDPSDITEKVGTQPTESWKKGDLHGKRQIEYRFSRWSLRSRLPETNCLEEHIADVLEQISVNKERFKEVSVQYNGCMQLVGIFNVDYPGLHFEHKMTERLAEFCLSVDFDFYHLWET